MKFGSKYSMLLGFINTMLSDKDDNYALVMPEITGDVDINVGNKKKRYMYVKGDIAFPYAMLTEQAKDIGKIPKIIHYAYIKKEYLTDTAFKHISDSENDMSEFLN